LTQAFENMEKESPFLKPVLFHFKKVITGRLILKSQLVERDIQVLPPDPLRFSGGQPLLTAESIQALIDPWGETAESTILTIIQAFPALKAELGRLRQVFEEHQVELPDCVEALFDPQFLTKMADRVGCPTGTLDFALSQLLKPYIEKRTEKLRPLIQNLVWSKGYCPICGALPELSFLQNDEGQRWLRCSLCGNEWRFDRMTCPGCEEGKSPIQTISITGSEHQWAELCTACRRYIVSTDLRQKSGVVTEIAALGMVHLDRVNTDE
jgi:FdhE protein